MRPGRFVGADSSVWSAAVPRSEPIGSAGQGSLSSGAICDNSGETIALIQSITNISYVRICVIDLRGSMAVQRSARGPTLPVPLPRERLAAGSTRTIRPAAARCPWRCGHARCRARHEGERGPGHRLAHLGRHSLCDVRRLLVHGRRQAHLPVVRRVPLLPAAEPGPVAGHLPEDEGGRLQRRRRSTSTGATTRRRPASTTSAACATSTSCSTWPRRPGSTSSRGPAPYINAEVDSGGLPGWLTTKAGNTRTDDPELPRSTPTSG